jgi:two-component system, chemotaxis family, protein-glutamate methylesterase/glutaminase
VPYAANVIDAGNGQIYRSKQQRDLVVIGASAGGVDALQTLVQDLPAEFPAAILVVLHVASTGTSVLPQILSRQGPLPAVFARDRDELRRGQILVAPADHHMLIHDGRIRLTRGPRENGHRPAVDPLFRSAGRAAGERTIGVVLSGLLDDGASGLRFIKTSGGAAVVQDPDDALFPSMPKAAMALTHVDRIVPMSSMAGVLCALIEESVGVEAKVEEVRVTASAAVVPADRGTEGADRVELEDPTETAALLHGPPTGLTCPECGGALWEQIDGPNLRFACHVGHAYSVASLVEEQGRSLETTLWSAVRALEERADMHRRLARRAGGSRRELYETRAADAEAHAIELRKLLAGSGRLAVPAPEPS